MHFVACPGGFYMLAKKLPSATEPVPVALGWKQRQKQLHYADERGF